MTEFSSALVTRAASLRDNPQYSDIIIPTRSFHAHKIILSARSSDWGRGVDLSSSVVLDWKAFSDQTCGALLRVHLENGHKFRPEQVLEDMRKHGAAPDKETYQCLISRDGRQQIASNLLALTYNLADSILADGSKIEEMSFCKLLKLAVNTEAEEDVLSCARIGQKLGLLTNKVLKKQIFPNLHNWPEWW